MALSIGIDVGGTNLRIGVFSGLQRIDETRFQADFSRFCKEHAPDEAWQKILNVTANAIQTVLQKHPDVETIGIGFPGFIDPQTQTIAQSPNLPGLKNVNLAVDLSQMTGKKVMVENDANAAAYGEYCLAGKPDGGLVYLGLGTGVGGGFVDANGKLYAGQHGVAMEVGHIIVEPHTSEPNARQCGCGNKGCMEQYASASGVAISYFNATQKQLSAYEIANMAENGDEAAIAAYERAANVLAQTLASIAKVIDIKNVVIGGGLTGAWSLMQAAFNQRLEADLIPVLRGEITVKISTADDSAGMLGAAMLSSAMLALT
jgi:glucokinase